MGYLDRTRLTGACATRSGKVSTQAWGSRMSSSSWSLERFTGSRKRRTAFSLFVRKLRTENRSWNCSSSAKQMSWDPVGCSIIAVRLPTTIPAGIDRANLQAWSSQKATRSGRLRKPC